MSTTVPEWLGEAYVITCLQKEYEDTKIAIKNLIVVPAVNSGYNYTSTLWRVKVEYKKGKENHHLTLIVKVPTLSSPLQKFFVNIWPVEPVFYEKFIPMVSKLLPNDNLVPKTFCSKIPNVVVMTYLKSKGYLMADRSKLLDFDHCRLYAIASATLHAASIAIHKVDPELIEFMTTEKMYSHDPEKTFISKALFKDGIKCLSGKMESMSAFKKYAALVRDADSMLWDKTVSLHQRHGKINALLQGDPWTPNMMFKYDSSGRVLDIRLLDFQELRYSFPLNDLVFFIWLSANHEVRKNRLDDLYRVYCDTFNNKLEACNCEERLTYEDLQKNLRELRPFFLFLIVVIYPMVTKEISDLDIFISENHEQTEHFVNKYYDSEYCNGELQVILKELEDNGVFEYLHEHPMKK